MTALALLTLLISFAIGSALAQAGETGKVIWPRSIEVKQGELVEIKMSGADLATVEGNWGKQKVFFFPNGDGKFAALIGADVEAKPTLSKLRLKAISQSGAEQHKEIALKVKAKSFQTESFNVPPSFDEMTPETLEEIRREQAAFARAFETSAPERLWDAPFVRPVAQQESASSFGSRRIINGTPRSPHSGTDLSAPAGTEVLAANHGRVVLVGNFFFAGGSVVLDHGGGLFTMYFHLSEFKVEDGALVKKGDAVGLSGATGRVTGPHLHWGARLANARIEPFELLKKISHNGRQNQQSKATNKTEQ
ncbi:MAG: M23 family metallopeptidase [Deltaproteobacteria bacterium]|nr:M23 family metallopeptidase [Deltaproteobacteria bacterium]